MTYICFPGAVGAPLLCELVVTVRVWGWETPTHQQAVKAVCPDSSLPLGPPPYQMLFSCLLPFYLHVLPPICHTLPICNIQKKENDIGHLPTHIIFIYETPQLLWAPHTPGSWVMCVLGARFAGHQLLSGWRKKGFPPSLAVLCSISRKSC